MKPFALWLLLALGILGLAQASSSSSSSSSSGKNKAGNEDDGEDDKFNDYEIYEAMESMRRLAPQSETFYDLFGLTSSATTEQIGRSFRKLSVKYHPDKATGPESAKMFNLLQYASTLLRDSKRRARYEWLLHEAPAWHRESVYMMKKISTTAKISLNQALWASFLFLVGGQFLLHWIAFGIQYGRILASRRGLKGMGEKEVKRIRKKLESGDAQFLVQNNSDMEMVLLADSPRPPFPSVLDLFIFAIPLYAVAKIKSVLVKPKQE